jgi:hypothetical protein
VKKMKKIVIFILMVCLFGMHFQGFSYADSASLRIKRLAKQEKEGRELWGKINMGLGAITLIGIASAYDPPDPNDARYELDRGFVNVGIGIGIIWLALGIKGFFFEETKFEKYEDTIEQSPKQDREYYAAKILETEAEREKKKRDDEIAGRNIRNVYYLLSGQWILSLLGFNTNPSETDVEKEYKGYLKDRAEEVRKQQELYNKYQNPQE